MAVTDLFELYQDLHRHPELSGAEERTAAVLARELTGLGFTVHPGIGGHGVVAALDNGEGPTVALRSELDALPLTERTGLSYAASGSAMHACGHDLHLAAVVGAAAELTEDRASWRGRLVVLGQPGEETLDGALAMVADGVHDVFGKPDAVLAQHAVPGPVGRIGHSPGPITAPCAELAITVHGRGGHAAVPHLAVDPVVLAAHLVVRLQSVVARETSPAEPVVVTVGSIHAGDAANVIPYRVRLGVSVRSATDGALSRALTAVERVCRAEAAASGAPVEPEIQTVRSAPATINDRQLTLAVRGAQLAALGPNLVSWTPPVAAAEDVSHLAEGAPLCYWTLGVGDRGTNHSPDFAPSPEALPAAVRALVLAAQAVFAPGR
ncbi:amidohydrolase [Amycolatopsis echigonensis]|uniref:Amidohydrolase n=1 Tax=Amycolatopsis echigonensis TaxID=2576905 RepID=A0A8E1VWP6_9PSEU|nr:amidohydrolase [Amycolatopsis echigonensis]MBB2499564.1 amidohydrolase [Amycolatopsis echigonensis]